MTKKHFIATAKAISKVSDSLSALTTNENEQRIIEAFQGAIAREMAITFESENAQFDRDRFLQACGVK